MEGMCSAADNLLRQLVSEGLDYRLTASGGTATILHLRVRNLTPETEERITQCLSGMGATLEIEDAGATDRDGA